MYLPLYIDLSGKKTVVFGLGKVGSRRAEKLRDSGAQVFGVDKRPVEIEGVDMLQREIFPDNIPSLDEYFLVVAATDNRDLNSAIVEKARAEGVLANRTGKFDQGDVVFPAVVETEDEKISVTTLGEDPSLAKKAMELLEIEISKD